VSSDRVVSGGEQASTSRPFIQYHGCPRLDTDLRPLTATLPTRTVDVNADTAVPDLVVVHTRPHWRMYQFTHSSAVWNRRVEGEGSVGVGTAVPWVPRAAVVA